MTTSDCVSDCGSMFSISSTAHACLKVLCVYVNMLQAASCFVSCFWLSVSPSAALILLCMLLRLWDSDRPMSCFPTKQMYVCVEHSWMASKHVWQCILEKEQPLKGTFTLLSTLPARWALLSSSSAATMAGPSALLPLSSTEARRHSCHVMPS